jgi:hypothetical protein
MKPGSAIINTASINSDIPNPTLLAYATTKGAIQIHEKIVRRGPRAGSKGRDPRALSQLALSRAQRLGIELAARSYFGKPAKELAAHYAELAAR